MIAIIVRLTGRRLRSLTQTYLKINGDVFRDTGNPNLPRHALWRPGMTWDSIGELDPKIRHPMNEGASDPIARLADMDAMGIDQSLLYPTWFAEGFHLVADPDVAADHDFIGAVAERNIDDGRICGH